MKITRNSRNLNSKKFSLSDLINVVYTVESTSTNPPLRFSSSSKTYYRYDVATIVDDDSIPDSQRLIINKLALKHRDLLDDLTFYFTSEGDRVVVVGRELDSEPHTYPVFIETHVDYIGDELKERIDAISHYMKSYCK